MLTIARRAIQICALSAGLGQFSPALAQERNSSEPAPTPLNKLKMPPVDPPAFANLNLQQPENEQPKVEPKFDPESPSPGVAKAPEPETNWTLVGLGALCSATAMGWFYTQLKRKETAISVASIGLYALNDGLLSAAALFTGQGVVGASVMGVISLGGFICARQAYKQREESVKFSTTDKVCAALCVPGILALVASKVPAVAGVFNPDILAVAGSVIGIAVNTIAAIPLIRAQLAKVEPGEKLLDTRKGKSWAIALPALPYVVGTAAMSFSVVTIPSLQFKHVFQPAVLLGTNVLFVALSCVWASRRLAPPPSEAPKQS